MEFQKEPMFNVPGAVIATVLVLTGMYVLQAYVLDEIELILQLAYFPVRFSLLLGYDPVQILTDRLSLDPGNVELQQRLALARELVDGDAVKPWTLFTYSLLHGGCMHLVLNCVWLLAFGTAIARRFGSVRFVLFLAVTAVAGALAHTVTHLHDVMPVIGASAAVSGCMAGAMRFAFQPGAPLGIGRSSSDQGFALPAHTLAGVFSDGRAMRFLVVWFVLNLATGIGAGSFGIVDATIAWEAHIGGFLAGLLLLPLFDPVPRYPA
ncbi:rhomboid family intramembrane serine protease [Nostoc sp. NIES-2111]